MPCEVYCMRLNWSWQILSSCSMLSTKTHVQLQRSCSLFTYLWVCYLDSMKLVIKNFCWLWGCLFSVAACKRSSLSPGSCFLLLVNVFSPPPRRRYCLDAAVSPPASSQFLWAHKSLPVQPVHALDSLDIWNPRGQFLLSPEQRYAQVEMSEWDGELNGETCHFFRPYPAIEEEGRCSLHLHFSLLDTSFRLLTKCYLDYC